MLRDSGRGIILPDSVEPIYGDRYLPRKFKIGVTVPGDNSLDIYTNDFGVVVICDDAGELVESYFGKKVEPWREMKPWKYSDWMGWWDQKDGKLFYGLHVDNGRVKDEGDFRLKSALRVIVDKYDLDMILSPTQSLILRDVDPKDKDSIDAIFREHGIAPIEEVDPLARLAMACPALPLCGLAQTEAERIMPEYIVRIRALLEMMNI